MLFTLTQTKAGPRAQKRLIGFTKAPGKQSSVRFWGSALDLSERKMWHSSPSVTQRPSVAFTVQTAAHSGTSGELGLAGCSGVSTLGLACLNQPALCATQSWCEMKGFNEWPSLIGILGGFLTQCCH